MTSGFFLVLFEKPCPQDKNLELSERKNKKNFQRIVRNLVPNLVSAAERLFVYAFDSVRENSDAVAVIDKNAVRKSFSPMIRPEIFFLYSLAHNRKRRRRFSDCGDNIVFRLFRLISDVASHNVKIPESRPHIFFRSLECLFSPAEQIKRLVMRLERVQNLNQSRERIVPDRDIEL